MHQGLRTSSFEAASCASGVSDSKARRQFGFLNEWDEPGMLHELLAMHPLSSLVSSSPASAPRSKPKNLFCQIEVGACELWV